MRPSHLGICILFLAASALAVVLQRQRVATRRAQVDDLRWQRRELDGWRKENERLAATAVPADQLAALRLDQQLLPGWRTGRAVLLQEAQRSARAADPGGSHRDLLPGMTPLDQLTNAGNTTPTAAARTFFWSVAQVDPESLAGQLTLGEAARAKAESLLASLDAATREKFSTPERMMAFFLVGLLGRVEGMQLTGVETQGGGTAWSAKLQILGGQTKDFDLPVVWSGNGWREEIPPEMVDHWSIYLRRGVPKS